MKLYGHALSGNVYKVKLLLALMGLEYEWIDVDLLNGEHKQPEFLALNPFGQVPVLVDGETVVADAQAALVYLARQYGNQYGDRSSSLEWFPLEPIAITKVIRWLSIATGEVRQGPESARLYHLFKVSVINIERATQKTKFILKQLDQHLSGHEWLAGEHVTIADIAVFPYVALAPDGKVDLAPYPQVLAWIEQVKQLPNFIGMAGI
ncbi:MAG: glutathione S-transferase [Cyanobacteria bacterium P01_D01_bin.1]